MNKGDIFKGEMSQSTSAVTSSIIALYSLSHKNSILSKFDKLRKRDFLCDITLVVEDVHFKAHKALLAASSEYFSLMFMAEDQISRSTYRLDGMAAKTFAAVLEFIYSAQVSVDESATEQLLVMAHLLEVSDLVQALSELSNTGSAAGVRAQVVKSGKTEALDQPKRKRGRPRKNMDQSVTDPEAKGRSNVDALVTEPEVDGRSAPCDGSEEEQVGDVDCGAGDPESQPIDSDDADYNPGTESNRQSKRKIRPPLKYKSYKVGSDTAESKVPGKRGRKRKYPDTEARCEDCDKVFKNHLFLKIHQRTHTGNQPCEYCTHL